MKYYFEIDSNNNPVEGSNRHGNLPKARTFRRYKEIIPLCCQTTPEVISNNGKGHYLIRLDENNNPVDGTLRRYRIKPTNGHFQFMEVTGMSCCTPVVAPSPFYVTLQHQDNCANGPHPDYLYTGYTINGVTTNFDTPLAPGDETTFNIPTGEYDIRVNFTGLPGNEPGGGGNALTYAGMNFTNGAGYTAWHFVDTMRTDIILTVGC
jgi:hypothetical protein